MEAKYDTKQNISNRPRLNAAVEDEIHIIAAQEEKWITECGGKIENGNATFKDEALGKQYGEWRRDMLNTEIDITLPECDLSAYIEGITISPAAIAALDGIVRFENGG